MKKYDIWIEGFLASGMEGEPEHARLLVSGAEGEDFADAVRRWYGKDPEGNEERYGALSIRNGVPSLWGCRLYDNESDARRSFG